MANGGNGVLRSGMVSPIAGMPAVKAIDPHWDNFPDGLVITLNKPGIALEVVATDTIARGSMIMVLPPEVAEQYRAAFKPVLDAEAKRRAAIERAAKANPTV